MAETLVNRVSEIIHRYNMLPVRARIGVAVSSGADSVALLHLLRGLGEPEQVEFLVLHMNHQLRGEESEADEAFVRSLAASCGLAFLGAKAVRETGNLEAVARRQRHEFFGHAKAEQDLAAVALGHTQSDQAETVLHHLLRGSGIAGLAGMRFVSPQGLIRPLLGVSRQEVRSWALSENLSWREDSSNADLSFTRNRLRLETMPALRASYNDKLEAALARTSELAQTEEDFWQHESQRLFSTLARPNRLGVVLPVSGLAALPLASRRRLVREVIARLNHNRLTSLDFSHVEAVLSLCRTAEAHDRVAVPSIDAIRSFDSLLLAKTGRLASEKRGYRLELTEDVCELPWGLGTICAGPVKPRAHICDKFKKDQEFSIQSVDLSASALRGRQLFIRNWEPGDKLQRAGHQSYEKVKRLFQESRIVLWERRHWPVVECEGEIVWVRRLGVSEGFAFRPEDAEGVELVYRSPAEGRDGVL